RSKRDWSSDVCSSDLNMLQVIFFALIFGVCILILEDKASTIKLVIDEGASVMYKMTDLIISLAPIGVFGLIAGIIGEQGINTLRSEERRVVKEWCLEG